MANSLTPEDRALLLLRLGRERAFAIGLSNILFIPAIFFGLRAGYPDYDATTFYVCEVIVVVICIVLNPQPYVAFGQAAREILSGAFGGDDDQPRSKPTYLIGSWQVVFGLLLPTVVVNVFATGSVINGTGGITASPFAAYAFTMVVLGIVMADRTRTMIVVLILGTGFFALLAYTTVLGEADPTIADGVSGLREQYFVVTVLNLAITWFVTWAARPASRRRGRVARAALDGEELEVVRARYGADGRYVDVTDLVRSQVSSDGRLAVLASNDLAGDPAPDVRKVLEVVYMVGAVADTAEVLEGQMLRLP